MSQTLYTTLVTVKSGRNGHATSADGLLDTPLSMPGGLGGTGKSPNPEQLFGAGYAACFGSSVIYAAGLQKVSLKDVTVDAEVGLVQSDSGYSLRVTLTVHAPELPPALAQSVLDTAHQICAYSNALRGNATVDIQLA